MDETQSAATVTYWCHMCNRSVDPVIEPETIECPLCQSGFVEEMSPTIEPDSDSAISLWAPVLLGMMSNPRRRRRFRRRIEIEHEDNDDEGETELDRELQSFIHTRRRNSATILQFLQGIRSGVISENENDASGRDTTEIRDRNRVILINPLNQTIVLQSGNFRNRDYFSGDYFVGPGLDLLMQHLAENDPNRHGTPPAKKEVVEAMPTVKIKDLVQCSVCLDDLEMGTEAKEMPCQHKFHSGCIFPWLDLHSSCPVCRYQLPCDGRKSDSDQRTNDNRRDNNVNNNNMDSRNNDHGSSSNGGGGIVEERNERSENRRGFPWPFSYFSSSGNRGSSSSSSSNATRNASSTDEN